MVVGSAGTSSKAKGAKASTTLSTGVDFGRFVGAVATQHGSQLFLEDVACRDGAREADRRPQHSSALCPAVLCHSALPNVRKLNSQWVGHIGRYLVLGACICVS